MHFISRLSVLANIKGSCSWRPGIPCIAAEAARASDFEEDVGCSPRVHLTSWCRHLAWAGLAREEREAGLILWGGIGMIGLGIMVSWPFGLHEILGSSEVGMCAADWLRGLAETPGSQEMPTRSRTVHSMTMIRTQHSHAARLFFGRARLAIPLYDTLHTVGEASALP